MTSLSEGAVLKVEAMEAEAEGECCSLCGAGGQPGVDLLLPEEYDQSAPPHLPTLRAMLLHLNHGKMLPEGRVCGGCAARGVDSYEFSGRLAARGAPPLSDKIRALRRRLLELTQKIDVFIVVGAGGEAGGYSEEDIIMVERDALAAAAAARGGDLERAHNARGDAVYQCSVCPLSFQQMGEFRAHIAGHPADSLHSCWTCGAQCGARADLKEHQRSHDVAHKVCHLCNHTFQSQGELSRHAAGCPSTCPCCGLALPSRAALAAHARAAHDALCPECFLALPGAAQLSAHALRHRQARHFVCGYDGCILRFATRSTLMSHIRKCHGGGASPAAPGAAAPGASAPGATNPAESAQAGAGSVDCTYCDRKFGSAAAMKRHRRVHRHELRRDAAEQDDMLGEAIEYLRAGGAGGEGGEGEEEAGEGEGEEEVEYLEMEALEEEPDTKPQLG